MDLPKMTVDEKTKMIYMLDWLLKKKLITYIEYRKTKEKILREIK
jgi:hypothetical protein